MEEKNIFWKKNLGKKKWKKKNFGRKKKLEKNIFLKKIRKKNSENYEKNINTCVEQSTVPKSNVLWNSRLFECSVHV